MTRTEHLLFILTEECAEVAQRASKAARFGMAEIEPEQDAPNHERITRELADLLAVAEMLGIRWPGRGAIEGKKDRVEMFLRYSEACGTLEEVEPSGWRE